MENIFRCTYPGCHHCLAAKLVIKVRHPFAISPSWGLVRIPLFSSYRIIMITLCERHITTWTELKDRIFRPKSESYHWYIKLPLIQIRRMALRDVSVSYFLFLLTNVLSFHSDEWYFRFNSRILHFFLKSCHYNWFWMLTVLCLNWINRVHNFSINILYVVCKDRKIKWQFAW